MIVVASVVGIVSSAPSLNVRRDLNLTRNPPRLIAIPYIPMCLCSEVDRLLTFVPQKICQSLLLVKNMLRDFGATVVITVTGGARLYNKEGATALQLLK